MEDSIIELAAGLTFRLQSCGPVDGPPLLLLGHVPDVPFSLNALATALARTTPAPHVLVPQQIDVGPDPSFRALAQDLAKLIEALNFGRVNVLGVGFGGTVAMWLAASFPQLVRALALLDSPLPDLHGINADLGRRVAEAFAYVSDFIDPRFEASVAAGDDSLLRQFWERASWWPNSEARYRAEFARPEFVARVAAAYRANFTLVDAGGHFTEADEGRVSAFGRQTASVRAGNPRRVVAPAFAPEPLLVNVPSLYYSSCPQLLPQELSGRGVLERFLVAPRIVLGTEPSLGIHVGDPDGVAALAAQFFSDVTEGAPLAAEAQPEKTREVRDSRYIVEQYDTKIRAFRSPAVCSPSIGSGGCALRGSHPKTHGVVHGRFVVADLPPELRIGLFGEPGTNYSCLLRFSSLGKPELEVFPDQDRDVRGLGIKLLAEDSEGALVTLADFLLNAIPILSTRRGRDVVPQRLEFLELTHLLQYSDRLVVPDVLSARYYSQTPYRYGHGRAVRYLVAPGSVPSLDGDRSIEEAVDRRAPDFLRRRLEYALAHATSEVVLDFFVQAQTDPLLDPIEDPRVEWRGPLQKVGELRMPRQSINQPEQAAHDEAIAFHLYHVPPEHAPLGEINRSRRAVYTTSPHLRRELNGHPKHLYPHRANPMDVCIVGSGVAGMGAAMALRHFGHRVTVVERRPNFGGHACSIDLPGGHSVDPAFGSFTAAAYPNVARLLSELGVEVEELGSFKEAISFFSLDGSRYWERLEDIPFARHVLGELERFDAWGILADENLDFVTAREYFELHGFSEEFIHYVFLGSIVFVFVGQPANYYLDYPIRQLVKYSYLPVVLAGREPVCRVKHGSASYMARFAETLSAAGVRLLAATETQVLRRDPARVLVSFAGATKHWEESFDHVVLAASPRDALKVLGEQARERERELLGAIPVTSDTVVIHRDPRFMPANRDHWRHANMIVPDHDESVDRDRPFMLTKWTRSNRDRSSDVFATYSYNRKLDVAGGVSVTFDHVKVTPEVVRLRRRIKAIQGQGRVWFCGSWMRAFTLHEDGLVSGLEAANGILAGLQEYPIIKPHELGAAKKKAPWGPQHTFLDVIEYQARLHSHKRALVFVDDACNETEVLSYGELLRRARGVAAALLVDWKVKPGDRVLLVYLPGLDFIVALLGSMMAGTLPVPAYPPNPKDLRTDLKRICSIVESSGASVALTTRGYRRLALVGSALSPAALWKWPRGLTWRTTDDLADRASDPAVPVMRPTATDTAFLQFTSGSTAEPRGVIISHSNLMHQLALITETLGINDASIGCCWVPQYHDLGLVGCILNALYNGAAYVFCSPLSFLRDPAIWGEMIHRYHATATAAPDFGYRLLVSRTTPEQRARWDWSSLRVAMSAGEPVHYETLRDFTEAFAPSGLEPRAFCPAYGLAEHVVAVTVGGARLYHLDKNELTLRHRLRLGEHRVVGCGRPPDGVKLAIVDPRTRRRSSADQVGEIWVSSPCKAGGYYGQPELSREVFEARIEGDSGEEEEGALAWLRTGDLGFMHHGELFVTGREKDLIILRGRNIYPVDIERAAEAASPSLRPGCSAAFLEDSAEGERLILCSELRKGGYDSAELQNICTAVRREVMKREGVHLGTVAFLAPHSVPKTTSGKVRRGTCSRLWIEGGVKTRFRDDGAPVPIQFSTSDALPARTGSFTAEDVIHAAVCEVTRCDVDRNVPLADQVNLDSVEFVGLVTLIEQRLQIRLPVTILNRYPTVAALAEYLRSRSDLMQPDPAIVTLNGDLDGSETTPLFLVHPARGGVECFLELARSLDVPIAAIRQTEDGVSVEALASRYVDAIKSVSPHGPYILGGYSFGATVCRAMACDLEARGEVVSGVLLLDEIHRPPPLLAGNGRPERGALLFEIAREYLPPDDLAALDSALAEHGDSDLDRPLAAVADTSVRKMISEQVRRYEHNVRIGAMHHARPPLAKMVLLRASDSYHRAPEMMSEIYDVPGDHFTMLRRPHVESVAAIMRDVLAAFASSQPLAHVQASV